MAQVTITLDQAGAPPGVAGFAREDLVTGVAVTATASAGSNFAWTLTWKPVDVANSTRSAAALSAPGASSTQITPIDMQGTYRLALAVDQGDGLGANPNDNAAITFYAGPPLSPIATEFPRRIPAFGETTEHNVPDAIDPGGNVDGWAREWERWFLALQNNGTKASWATQTNWWIDPVNGDDGNDGAHQTQGSGLAGPLKTLTEHFRRIILAGGYRSANTVVNILGNTLTTDEPRGTVNVYTSATVLYTGALGITVIRSGTFSAATAANPATNQGTVGTDSVGATWSAYISTGALGIRVKNTTAGARFGLTAWCGKDLTAGQCRFSQFYAPTVVANGALQTTWPTPEIAVNDTYEVQQLPTLQGAWGINFNCDSTQGLVTATPAVAFQDLCMRGGAPVLQTNQYGIMFFSCDVGWMRVWAPFRVFINCDRVDIYDAVNGGDQSGTEWIRAGIHRRNRNLLGPSEVIIDQRFYTDSGISVYGGHCILSSFQAWGGNGCYVAGGSVIVRSYITAKEIFGECGAAAHGWSIDNGKTVSYDNLTGVTVTGASGDVMLSNGAGGGITKSYGQLPFLASDIAGGSGTYFSGMFVGDG